MAKVFYEKWVAQRGLVIERVTIDRKFVKVGGNQRYRLVYKYLSVLELKIHITEISTIGKRRLGLIYYR